MSSNDEFKLSIRKRSKRSRHDEDDDDDDDDDESHIADIAHQSVNLNPDDLIQEIERGEKRMRKERAKHEVLIDDKLEEDPFSKKDREMMKLFEEQQKRAALEAANAPRETKEEIEKRRKQLEEMSIKEAKRKMEKSSPGMIPEKVPPTQEEVVAAQNEEIKRLRLELAEKAKKEREAKEYEEQKHQEEKESRVRALMLAEQRFEQEEKDKQQLEVYNQQLHELMMARNAIKNRLAKTQEDNEKIKAKEILRQTNKTPEDLAKAKENNAIYQPSKGVKPTKGRRGIGVSHR